MCTYHEYFFIANDVDIGLPLMWFGVLKFHYENHMYAYDWTINICHVLLRPTLSYPVGDAGN